MNINTTYGKYTNQYLSINYIRYRVEFCYSRRAAVKSDFSRGMQVGIRYLCIKDIIIVDSIKEDGSRQKTLTESECNAKFRYKYELMSRLNIDGRGKRICEIKGIIGN